MWGHSYECDCAVCHTLPRVHQLVDLTSSVPGALEFVGKRLKDLEAEIWKNFPPGLGESQAASTPSQNTDLGYIAFRGPRVPSARGSIFSSLAPPAPPAAQDQSTSSTPKPLPLNLGAKVKPAEPPEGLHGSTKVEPNLEQESREPVQDVKDLGRGAELKRGDRTESPKLSKRKREKEKRRKRSRSQSKEREAARGSNWRGEVSPRGKERKSREESSRPRKTSWTPSRSPAYREERSAEKKGEKRSPSERQEVEGKQRHRSRLPEPPPFPPPRAEGHQRKGPGWVGHIPRSEHARWRGKNKGIVKRAKQERFNNRQR